MQKRIVIKNHIEEIHLITRRCVAMLIIMLILIVLLIFRLGFLQLAKQNLYTTLSNKNCLDLLPLEPTRGLIYDRNGVLLAENLPVFSLDVIPEKINNLPQVLANIGKIVPLTSTELAQFQKELKQYRRFEEIPLKFRLSEAEVARFSENQYRFPGVVIKARLMRHYPFAGTLSHVLGYVGRINEEELDDIDPANYSATNYIGKLGIEKFYENELHGTVGYERAENDASGQSVRILNKIKPIPGENLYLTIDLNLQLAAEKALQGHRGAIVAIQPATGQILAMVSEPSYDPNVFVNGISNTDFNELQKSIEKPLYNRALRGLYPLASTIKPFIALEGLDSGVANLDFFIADPGWYQLPNSSHVFHDWKRHGHGMVNLIKAIITSCDTYFYDLAHKMGIQRIDTILTQFGFGQLTGVDSGEELAGLVASPTWKRKAKGLRWYEGDTIVSVIGQGYMQATPLQLATAVSTIANRGQRFTPHFLLAKENSGKPRQFFVPALLPPIHLSQKEYWETIIQAMAGVLTSPEGTGYHFGKLKDYTAAAKTGTAQVYSQKHRDNEHESPSQLSLPEYLRDHSLFIAFMPVEKPQIAIAVIVENSALAASVARSVLDYYYFKIGAHSNDEHPH